MSGPVWYCCRQRAGPLVKECRALRPRFGPDDTATDRKEKEQLRRRQYGTFERRQVDRLELRLALLGFRGTMHTLTFDSEHLPQRFNGVRLALERSSGGRSAGAPGLARIRASTICMRSRDCTASDGITCTWSRTTTSWRRRRSRICGGRDWLTMSRC